MTTTENNPMNNNLEKTLKELDLDPESLEAFRNFIANNPKDPKVLQIYEILAKIEEIKKN